MSSAAFLLLCYLRHQVARHEIDFKKFGLLPELFCLGSLGVLQSGSQWDGAKCFQCVLLLDGLLETLCCFSFSLSLQEAEWHCDEFTKGACFSRGKSEVSLSDAWAFEVSHCYILLYKTSVTALRETSFFSKQHWKKYSLLYNRNTSWMGLMLVTEQVPNRVS